MKIELDIDRAPAEPRAFLGLPDLGPVHRAVVDELGAKTAEALKALDPEAMIKAWLGSGAQGVEAPKASWTRGGADKP